MRYQIIKQIQTEKINQSYPFAECVDFRSACLIADTLTEHVSPEPGYRITFLIQP